MAAKKEVVFTIRARDMTRSALRSARRGIERLGRAARSVTSLVGAGIIAAAARQWAKFGAEITAASERLDMSTVTLQSWKKQASDVANVGGEQLFNVFQRIGRNAGAALRGNTKLIMSFAKMGVSFRELRTISPDELMLRVAAAAEKFNKAGRRKEFSSILADIGDSEAVRLLGLLERGPSAFIQETERLLAAGVFQTTKQLSEAAKTKAQLEQEFLAASAEFSRIMVVALPLITQYMERLNAAISLLSSGASGGGGLEATSRAIDSSMIGVSGSAVRAFGGSERAAFNAENNAALRYAERIEKQLAGIRRDGGMN